MEFQYSDLVSRDSYQTDQLCDGIDVRINRDTMGEISGAIRCQKDWSKLVSRLRNYKGTLGSPFSFVRVTVPEALPGRLEIISYANEFAFLYDDTIMEDIDQNFVSSEEHDARRKILDDFGSGEPLQARRAEYSTDKLNNKIEGTKQIRGQIFSEMLAIDKERAMTTMKLWQKFVQVVSSRQRSEPFLNLDEYLPYRISDAGELFWFGLVTFGMGLTIPEDEMGLCKDLGRPSWAALALTNDLYSWEKELDAATKAGAPHVINGIWVLMKEHSLTETEAKILCRKKIREFVADARRIVEKNKLNTNLSSDLRIYLEAILYSISGNLVWSIYCPRYHEEERYDSTIESKMAKIS